MSGADLDMARYLEPVLRRHREQYQRNGSEPPTGVLALELLCRFRLSEGQPVSSFDCSCSTTDDQVMVRAVTYDQAATMLSVSLSTVKRLVESGELRKTSIGGAARIQVVDIDAYLSRQVKEPA